MEACQSLHLSQLSTNQSSASKYWTHARKYYKDPCRLSFTQRACSQARFFCVGVMYSGEYGACDVTLSVYPHRASLRNMPDHGGNRTYDFWNTSPMLCQLSYTVLSVRVCDISEQNLVPSISMLSNNNHDFSVLV